MPLLRVITLVSLIFSATAAANSAVPDYRHLSIRGEAQLKTTPDQAKITLQVKVIKTSALEAKQEADKRVNKLLAGLKGFDITDDDVSASNLLTEPHVNFDENDVEIIAGYVATRTVKVTLSDLNKINEFINFALSLEINEIEDIDLLSSQEALWIAKATQLAVQDAKSKAENLASAFAAKLGKIYSINANRSNQSYGYRGNGLERIEVTGSRIKAGDLVPGRYLQATIFFSASIDVVFDLTVE